MKTNRKYQYNRSDFKPLPVRLEHMNIYLNFLDGKVEGTNTLWMTARKSLDSISLDARDITIHSVMLAGKNGKPLDYDYPDGAHVLVVKLPECVKVGQTFAVTIRATCVPSDNILEGIYKDTNPPGCPQQYMSQCQQWGFQRILPVLDDCTAKCTMVTTIEADARYTHLISNGDIRKSSNPDGRPVPVPGNPSRQIITYENLIPMAPYLFIACIGTWDMLEDEIVYPSGRHVKLEYLVPPGRKEGAKLPMQILKESVLWQGRTQEYEYCRDVYRTICMEKSNFGGMENTGNTTIITDAALIDEFTGDARFKYAHGVIVHEFEHNQCGSDVTMETPFDMWLNEAFTVDVERQFLESQFDPDRLRLDEVDAMRAPVNGPQAIEDAGHMGNIVRQGFNDPDELVDGVTYVKAAEVIRMLRLVLGEAVFKKAVKLYFKTYTGSNANTDQFFKCFEKASGRNLSQFKKEWLFTIGYPVIEAAWKYDCKKRKLSISLTQKRVGRGGLFHVPVELAAVDSKGKDIRSSSEVVELTSKQLKLEFKNVPEPAFVSFNRDCSFYGTFKDKSVSREQLVRQVQADPNRFNRVEAMRRLTDMERIALIKNPAAVISKDWLSLYEMILKDMSLPYGLKAYLLRIDEQSVDRKYLPFCRERYAARITLLKAVAENCMPALRKAFDSVDTYALPKQPKDGIEERLLKGILLRTIVEANTSETHKLAENHFHKAWNITDRISTLHCINLSEHPRRSTLMEEGFELWKDHLSAYASYLGIVGSGIHDDVFDLIVAEEKRPTFTVQHPTHSRALYLPMAGNNKMLWTDRGIQWMTDTVIRLSSINENTVIRLVAAFQQFDKLADDLRPKVLKALKTMHKNIDQSAAPSVAGRINAFLDLAR
ncbi:MAG: peptidase M1 [Lentisphaerae bacterium RIFOXYA12_FULL_48_11]|nr:MAG: peptidase M1 [Lentisphaerae bacterium RIFOXYA12_FULL_48_11]